MFPPVRGGASRAPTSGGEGAALHPRRVFDPFETLFAIVVDWFLLSCARVRLDVRVELCVRPLIGRATGLRGIGVLAGELWLGSVNAQVDLSPACEAFTESSRRATSALLA